MSMEETEQETEAIKKEFRDKTRRELLMWTLVSLSSVTQLHILEGPGQLWIVINAIDAIWIYYCGGYRPSSGLRLP